MPATLEGKLVVAVSSRALFDFEEENRIFDEHDDIAYMELQRKRLDVAAPRGVAFALVRKLLAFNTPDAQRVEVVILSRNDPVSGLRVFHSAKAHGLALERGVFTRGRPASPYLAPLRANLFLSASEEDVREALARGFPAALVYPRSVSASEQHPDEVRIAFDGDAVLFSDEAERVYQRDGLDAFTRHESDHLGRPLPPGPFKPLLEALHTLQRSGTHSGLESGKGATVPMKVRTALVTARSAPAHERAIRTLMDWGIDIDEAMFLGGLEKGPFLEQFQPDFFFDDQTRHCESGALAGPTGRVPNDLTG